MPKIDWSNLRIVEEWTSLDPSNSNALATQQQNIQQLSLLILKAFKRHQLAKTKRVKQKPTDAE